MSPQRARPLGKGVSRRSPNDALPVFLPTAGWGGFAAKAPASKLGSKAPQICAFSPDLRQVWDLMNAGKDPSAAQERVTAQRHILEKYPPFPPTLKALLHRLHGLPRWSVKPPLEPLPAELEEQVLQDLQTSHSVNP